MEGKVDVLAAGGGAYQMFTPVSRLDAADALDQLRDASRAGRTLPHESVMLLFRFIKESKEPALITELIGAAREMYELADQPSEGKFDPSAAAFLKADARCRAALASVTP